MATLKMSDLSVGDWVHHDFYEVDMRVRTIYGDTERIIAESNDGYGVTCHLDHFRPIPITAEILEANGFVDNGVGQHYLKCGNGITARVGRNPLSHDDCWLVATDKQVDETISTTCVLFDAKHIHQLQHALRLAGVDKEIVMPNK